MGSRESSVEGWCDRCPKYNTCTKPCEPVEAMLPHEDTARSHLELYLGDRFEVAAGPTEISDDEHAPGQVDRVEEAKNLFWYGAEHLTKRQLLAYVFRVRDDMRFAEIGKKLECSRQAAYTHYLKAVKRLTNSA